MSGAGTTRDQGYALAELVHQLRPEWDKPGILAALGKVAHRDPFAVSLAAVRWANHPDTKTPGGIPNPGPHWDEQVFAPPRGNPRPGEGCHLCAKHIDQCICRDDDGRPTGPTLRPPSAERAPATPSFKAARQAALTPEETH